MNYDVSPVWIKQKILSKLESDCKITRTRGSPEFFRFVSLTHLSPVLNEPNQGQNASPWA